MSNKKMFSGMLSGQVISRRTFIIGAGKLGLLFLLAGRMFYMQFIKKSEYKTLSDQNRIKTIIIPPNRGYIYDRSMRVIAKNNACFRLLLDKNISSNFEEEIKFVAEILELDSQQIKEVAARVKKASRRIPSLIMDCLSWEQISILEERKELLKALFVETGAVRFYKYNKATAHLIGYMGRVDKNQKNSVTVIDENFRVGKNGVENFYEEILRGEFGYKQIEVNAHGKYVRELSKTPTIAGNHLQLNIDAELQKEVTSFLNQLGSSAILMDCLDGGVVLSASVPSYDPNNFNFLSNKYWLGLIKDSQKPLINKTVHSLYPPGSIFKLVTVLAALEYGIDPGHIVNCNGGPALGGNNFRCAKRTGHGPLNMHDAIKYSCNIYMFELSRIIGPEVIINMAKRFQFGIPTGVDLPNELAGFVPTLDWKKQTLKSRWSLGDSFNLSIGQGFLLCTPMQLARFITAIATGGKLYTPNIAKRGVQYVELDVDANHLNFLKNALYDAVNSLGGTGYSGKLADIWQGGIQTVSMAGKTGTAQVVGKRGGNDDLSRESISWTRRNHAMFAGFAPHDAPKYTVTVYYDHGGGGGRAAAPIAKMIMEKALRMI